MSVPLQFVNENQIALPIHDGLIMRGGFAGDFNKPCRRPYMMSFRLTFPVRMRLLWSVLCYSQRMEQMTWNPCKFIWHKPAPMDILT